MDKNTATTTRFNSFNYPSKKQIGKLQKILQSEYGAVIELNDAEQVSVELLELFDLLTSIDTSRDSGGQE